MDHFLVDYENIGEAGLKGIENLSSDTSTVIFYSEHADKISFDMHQALCRCRSKIEFRKAQTGKKNALDFQLSTYLGYLVASHPNDRFYIISKDTGYRVVMDFWNNAGITQLDYIGRAYEKPVKKAPEPENDKPAAEKPAAADAAPALNAPQEQAHQEPDHREPDHQEQKFQPRETKTNVRRRSPRPKEPQADEFKPSEELMNSLSQIIESEEERENIGRFIVKYKTKQGVNNAIVKMYGTEKAGELYRKVKPLLNDKKGK